MVRAPDCGSGCRGFESLYPPQTSRESRNIGSGSFVYLETCSGHNGVSPSGKARDFDSRSRWFESGHPSHFLTAYDPIAQSVEHLPFKQGVRGSSPRWVTTKNLEIPMNFEVFLFFVLHMQAVKTANICPDYYCRQVIDRSKNPPPSIKLDGGFYLC